MYFSYAKIIMTLTMINTLLKYDIIFFKCIQHFAYIKIKKKKSEL